MIIFKTFLLTLPLCVQAISGGGSGRCFTIHVRFIVDPVFINKSSPPKIVVIGSTTDSIIEMPTGGVVEIWFQKKREK